MKITLERLLWLLVIVVSLFGGYWYGGKSGEVNTKKTIFDGQVVEWQANSGHLKLKSNYIEEEKGYLINPREMSVVWMSIDDNNVIKDQEQILDVIDVGWQDFFCTGDRVLIYAKKGTNDSTWAPYRVENVGERRCRSETGSESSLIEI